MRVRTFGDILIELREMKDELQKSVAVSCGIKASTWSQYEKNKRVPSIQIFKKIAEYYNVSIDYLINRTDLKYNPEDVHIKRLISKYTSLPAEKRAGFIDYIEKYKGEI